MRYKPILFNTEMVRAILDGRKTQTRRVIKPQPEISDGNWGQLFFSGVIPYTPGDIMWVRETWDNIPVSPGGHFRFGGRFYYKADGDFRPDGWNRGNWRPSIHMPKEAARIFLRVKDVRMERLKDILTHSGEVAKEGIPYDDEGDREASGLRFKEIWDSTIKPIDRDDYGWEANPWVWVIEFERIDKPLSW